MSENTVSYGDFVRLLFNRSGDPSRDFTHAILGIVTEIHEYLSAVDDINGLEELGDLAFYLLALAQVVEDVTGVRPAPSDNDIVRQLGVMLNGPDWSGVISEVTNDLLDNAKRWVGYGKEPAELDVLFANACALVAFVNATGPFPCNDVKRIRAANRAKLNVRYQDKFSQAAATNRDLAAEHAALASA